MDKLVCQNEKGANHMQKLGMILFKRYIKQNGIPDLIHCQSIFNKVS